MPATAHSPAATDAVVLRPAREEDATSLIRLAALDSASPLTGDVLLAEHDGAVRAAIEVASGRAIADPFHPTTDLLDLLRSRAASLRRAVPAPARRVLRRSPRRVPAV